MVQLGKLWTRTGRATDSYGVYLQSLVNEAIVTEVSRVICGERWGHRIEDRVKRGLRPTYHELLTAAGDTPEERDIARQLQEVATSVSTDPIERTIAFSDTLGLNEQSFDTVSNVVRLATVPGTLSLDQAGNRDSIDLVLTVPSVFQLARGFVVAIANYQDTEPFSTLGEWLW
jgi:hypothetical protein